MIGCPDSELRIWTISCERRPAGTCPGQPGYSFFSAVLAASSRSTLATRPYSMSTSGKRRVRDLVFTALDSVSRSLSSKREFAELPNGSRTRDLAEECQLVAMFALFPYCGAVRALSSLLEKPNR